MDVWIDTAKRLNPNLSLPSNCRVPLAINQSLGVRPYVGGYTTQFCGCNLYWSWHGIDSRHDTIRIDDTNYTIPEGTYTYDDMLTLLNTGGTSGAPLITGLTWSFSNISGKLTVANGSGSNVTLNFSHADFTADLIFGVLSTETTADVVVADSASYTFSGVYNSTYVDTCYVLVDWPGVVSYATASYGVGGRASAGFYPILCTMKAPAAWGDQCIIEFQGATWWHSESIPDVVNMTLYDHEWNEMNVNGFDWQVHFKLWDLPGQAKSPNHVTMVGQPDHILSNTNQENQGISGNSTQPARATKRPWANPSIPAPPLQEPAQKKSLNVLSYPQTH